MVFAFVGDEEDGELEGEEFEEDEDGIEDNEEDGDDADEGEWEAFDEDSEEKCPVCLDNFFDKEVGTPESCDHVFCLECILEWSRVCTRKNSRKPKLFKSHFAHCN